MFYDDVFQDIMEDSAFSEKAVLTIGLEEYALYGFFCSGNYGQKDFTKGYALDKSLARQSFKISKQSLPNGVTVNAIARKQLFVRGTSWIIDDVTGNDSGILCLSLKEMANG